MLALSKELRSQIWPSRPSSIRLGPNDLSIHNVAFGLGPSLSPSAPLPAFTQDAHCEHPQFGHIPRSSLSWDGRAVGARNAAILCK